MPVDPKWAKKGDSLNDASLTPTVATSLLQIEGLELCKVESTCKGPFNVAWQQAWFPMPNPTRLAVHGLPLQASLTSNTLQSFFEETIDKQGRVFTVIKDDCLGCLGH